MEVDDVIAVPFLQNTSSDANGKNEGLEALRPHRPRHYVLTEPAVHFVPQFLELASVI
jgi:hypothetical protein